MFIFFGVLVLYYVVIIIEIFELNDERSAQRSEGG